MYESDAQVCRESEWIQADALAEAASGVSAAIQ